MIWLPQYDDNTTMHIAHYTVHKETIIMLITAGDKLNTPNLECKTPLHYLLESTTISPETKTEIITTFLSQYKDQQVLTVLDKAESTPISLAEVTHLPDEVIKMMMSTIQAQQFTICHDEGDAVHSNSAEAVPIHVPAQHFGELRY